MLKNKYLPLFLSIIFFTGCSLMWATEFEFAKDNFNGGILAVNENKDQALLFYIDQEKIIFADILDKNGNVIGRDVKEEWMKDSGQRWWA